MFTLLRAAAPQAQGTRGRSFLHSGVSGLSLDDGPVSPYSAQSRLACLDEVIKAPRWPGTPR